MMVVVIILLAIQGFSFMYFNYELTRIEDKVDYRYFLTKSTLEDIHKVKIEDGRVVWRSSKYF